MADRYDRPAAIAAFPALRAIERQLAIYEALLRRWQARINLVSATTLPELWWRHFADSIQLLPFLPASEQLRFVDLGSGAGFPGMVLALSVPKAQVQLVESDRRKVAFLREVSRETGANVAIAAERAETVVQRGDAPDVVTSRALASPALLAVLAAPWLRTGSAGLFLTGASSAHENVANVHCRATPSRTGPGFVLEMRQAESEQP